MRLELHIFYFYVASGILFLAISRTCRIDGEKKEFELTLHGVVGGKGDFLELH